MGWRNKFQHLKGATIELHWQDCGREKSEGLKPHTDFTWEQDGKWRPEFTLSPT